jgi:hypothetical protein
VDTEGLVLKAKVHSAKVPDQDGLRLLLKSARTGGSRAFLTCGWMQATRAGAEKVGRGGDGLERGEIVRKPPKPVPEEVAKRDGPGSGPRRARRWTGKG